MYIYKYMYVCCLHIHIYISCNKSILCSRISSSSFTAVLFSKSTYYINITFTLHVCSPDIVLNITNFFTSSIYLFVVSFSALSVTIAITPFSSFSFDTASGATLTLLSLLHPAIFNTLLHNDLKRTQYTTYLVLRSK